MQLSSRFRSFSLIVSIHSRLSAIVLRSSAFLMVGWSLVLIWMHKKAARKHSICYGHIVLRLLTCAFWARRRVVVIYYEWKNIMDGRVRRDIGLRFNVVFTISLQRAAWGSKFGVVRLLFVADLFGACEPRDLLFIKCQSLWVNYSVGSQKLELEHDIVVTS